jgi:hypothetical protein
VEFGRWLVWLSGRVASCPKPCVCLCVCVHAGVFGLCVVVLYCCVASSYPVFLLNGMKRSSPAFSRKKRSEMSGSKKKIDCTDYHVRERYAAKS